MKRALGLGVAATAFLGWIGWLAYAAWTKERGPILSRSLLAVATHPVVAELSADEAAPSQPSSRVHVRQALSDRGPPGGTTIEIHNLPRARGWQGAGEYLLLLVPADPRAEAAFPPRFLLVTPPRSAGYDPADALPLIYPWTDAVRRQWEQRGRW
jgi:hypothetical protein